MKKSTLAKFGVMMVCMAGGAAWGLDITGTVVVDESSVATYAALTASDEINVAADAVLDFQNAATALDLKAKLVGAGTVKATSAANLTLSGDNSGFSGAFDFLDTRVVVNNAAALGTATVTFKNSSKDTGKTTEAMELFFTAAGTYSNHFLMNGKFALAKSADVVFTGEVELNLNYRSEIVRSSSETGSFTFAGKLKRTGSAAIYSYGQTSFASSMTGKGFGGLGGSTAYFVNDGASLTLDLDLSSATDFSALTAKGTIICARANVFAGGQITLGTSSSPYGTLNLNGCDQVLGTLGATWVSSTLSSSAAKVTSSTPATLTIKATSGSSGIAYVIFVEQVSPVFGDGTSAQNFKLGAAQIKNKASYFVNTTTGTLTLDSPEGELALLEHVSFTQLAGVVVKAGSLVLQSGVQVTANDLTLGTAGSLELPEGYTYTCERLFVIDDTAPGGVRQLAAGTYTAASLGNLPAGALVGAGELVVNTNPPVEESVTRTWQGATGAAFEAAANWVEGAAPDADARNAKVIFAAEGAGESATLTADAAVYGVEVNKNFTLEGAEQTLELGTNGLVVAASCAFTNNSALYVDAHEERWTVGAGSELVLNGALSSLASDSPLTIAGPEGVANAPTLVFNGSGADLGVAGVVATNVAAVTVGSSDAFGAAGLTTYNVMPYFTVSSNASPFTVRGVVDEAIKYAAFFDAAQGPFIQTGPVRLEGTARIHFNFWNSATFCGGITLAERTQFNFKTTNETVVRIANSPVTSVGSGNNMDIRGQLCASNVVFLAVAHTNIAASILLGRAKIVCGAANVLPQTDEVGLSLGVQSSGKDGDRRIAWLDLNGFDQTFYLKEPPKYSMMNLKLTDHVEISSATSATLTSYSKTKGSNGVQLLKFTGQVSFTQDVGTNNGLTLSNIVSTTTGALWAKRGKLKFVTNAGWGGGTDVTIGSNGRIIVAADAAHSAFASANPTGPRSIVQLAVEKGGILELEGGTVAVAAAYRPEGEGTAAQLRTAHARGLKRGYYAAADAAEEAGVTRVDWIAGAGKLHVLGQSGTSIYLR